LAKSFTHLKKIDIPLSIFKYSKQSSASVHFQSNCTTIPTTLTVLSGSLGLFASSDNVSLWPHIGMYYFFVCFCCVIKSCSSSYNTHFSYFFLWGLDSFCSLLLLSQLLIWSVFPQVDWHFMEDNKDHIFHFCISGSSRAAAHSK
jgi:hypothetical protein